MNSLLYKTGTRAMLMVCLGIMMLAILPQMSEATHFRSGTISWVPTENPGEVEFRMKTVWRGNIGNWATTPIGGNIRSGTIQFGDGTSLRIEHTVVNRNTAENIIEFEAVFRKTYSSDGPFLAVFQICCRISNSGNAANTFTRLETIVSPNSGNSSPVSNQFPLVTVQRGDASSFTINAADPDNDEIRFRLPTLQESRFSNQVPGMSIDENTGVITWDNTGLNENDLWSVQIMVEDLDEDGNVKSKIPVEFVMQIVESQENVPAPPSCDLSMESPIAVSLGDPVSFDITGTTEDADVLVTLAGIGLPSGSSVTPSLPLTDTETVSTQFNWTPSASQTGSYVFTFAVTDQYSQQTQCGATVNVTTNQPPVADAGSDQTVECPACEVELDGSGSYDPDDDPLTYLWEGEFGEATGVNPTVKLPLGEHTITLTVDDGNGETDTDDVVITVVDTTPPELVMESDAYILWPPNHKYHTFDVADFIVSASDTCDENVDESGVVITLVTSDEPENQTGSNNGRGRGGRGGGDGNTVDDIVIANDGRSVDLRAERLGGGNGRVYTVHVGVVDGSGNTAESSFQVHVPQNPNRPAIDDGVAYEVSGVAPQAPASSPAASMASSPDGGAAAAADQNRDISQSLPETFGLQQNYPNPFNPVTVISYQVPGDYHVSIDVYDMTGRRVATLVNESRSQGSYDVSFDASSLSSGIYVYRITAGNYSEVRRMTLVK